MTSHPNTSNFRYFKVSPRGFANELIYFRVPLENVDDVNRQFEGYEDHTCGYCNWTDDRRARIPGIAVNWEDRVYVGF